MRNNQGFTLFEIMLVFGLVMFLSAVGMLGYGRMQANSELTSAADEIRTMLRQAREKSVAQIDDKSYRVVGNVNVVTMEDSNGVELYRYQLRSLVTMSPSNFSYTFAKITGAAGGCASSCVITLSSGGLTRTIEISGVGLIE